MPGLSRKTASPNDEAERLAPARAEPAPAPVLAPPEEAPPDLAPTGSETPLLDAAGLIPDAITGAGPAVGPSSGKGSGAGSGSKDATPSTAQARFDAAERRMRQITDGIAAEDATSGGRRAKTLTVAAQVATQQAAASRARDSARAALTAGAGADAAVGAFEAAVATFERAYLASALESTDGAAGGAWAASGDRDVLGASGAEAKIRRWQDADGFVKFAVPTGIAPNVVRVGSASLSHVDIAGGTALAAGLLRFSFAGGRATVSELENTSGGFRPGPLRNATASAAITAAGYTVGVVDDNPDGTYEHSRIAR